MTINVTAPAKKESGVEIRTHENTFDYGEGCFVDRFDLGYKKNGKSAKDHVQYRVIDGERVWKGFKKLYRIDEALATDKPLIFAEGERKVNKLWEGGFAAFCNVGGSGGWVDEYADRLVGRTVLIWPDNDEPGMKIAEKISESCRKRSIPHHILNKLTIGLPDTGDVLDWLKLPGNGAAKLQEVIDEYLDAGLYEVLDYYDLIALPGPQWLIEPLLIKSYVCCVYGPTQTAKSFWVLDKGMQLAEAGQYVLYLAGENSIGYGHRMRAWYQYFEKQPNSFIKFIRRPVNFLKPDAIQNLIKTIERKFNGHKPVLIIVDTLSKSYQGGDENDSTDMREFVLSCEVLRDTFDSTVLVNHHTPKSTGGTPRGSGVITGDFDTLIEAAKDTTATTSKRVTFTCTKQKDAKEFGTILYDLVEPTDGFDLEDSCVLDPVDTNGQPFIPGVGTSLHTTDTGKAILETIGMEIYSSGIGPTSIMDQLGIPHRKEPKAKSSFNRELNNLLVAKFIQKRIQGKFSYYTLTPKGNDVIKQGNFGF